eukprot:TRINITY_DN1294_c0_g1_i11.p1 TRINITY_DN1294_c0_g1~~TRINITY_DN1294_c0_g1_i11.p1  ORF type:complete len:225 (-),score=80.70 TRINITY_DN1294_c0_g1_i11:66-698(-)
MSCCGDTQSGSSCCSQCPMCGLLSWQNPVVTGVVFLVLNAVLTAVNVWGVAPVPLLCHIALGVMAASCVHQQGLRLVARILGETPSAPPAMEEKEKQWVSLEKVNEAIPKFAERLNHAIVVVTELFQFKDLRASFSFGVALVVAGLVNRLLPLLVVVQVAVVVAFVAPTVWRHHSEQLRAAAKAAHDLAAPHIASLHAALGMSKKTQKRE